MANKRWVCPLCNAGVNAPARMRKTNPKRYCLPCSANSSRMVERVCPSLDNARAKKAVTRSNMRVRKIQSVKKRAVKGDVIPHDMARWNRLVTDGDKMSIYQYLTENGRRGLKPEFVGRIQTAAWHPSNVSVSSDRKEVWLHNTISGHPLKAVFLGLIAPLTSFRTSDRTGNWATQCLEWGSVRRWVAKPSFLTTFPKQDRDFRSRLVWSQKDSFVPSRQEALVRVRKAWDKALVENWDWMWSQVLPLLMEGPKRVGHKRNRKAKFLAYPASVLWSF